MSINANRLVSIQPRVISGGSADLETNGLVLSASDLIPAGTPALEFTTARAVGEYFGAESPEYDFAAQYFAGANNQQKGISTLWIGRRIATAASAMLIGAKLTQDLAALKTITAGSLTLTIGGTQKKATTLDLGAATSLSDVATKLGAAIGNNVSVEYNAGQQNFIIRTTETGANASITVATGSSADPLGLSVDAGAYASAGSDALTPSANMDAICTVTRNWVGFTTLDLATEEDALAFAEWADIDDDYVYFDWALDARMLSASTSANTKAAKLQSYNCAAAMYGDAQDVAFMLAIGASIDWNREQGIKTWFAKTTSGINPRILDDQTAEVLDDLRCNYYGKFAARNSNFRLMNRGILTGKLYGFIDVLYGMIWFKSKIQTSVMDGMAAVNRAPYNERGYGLIEAWLVDPIAAARKNGVIDTGMLLSASQNAQITNEVGEDISRDLYSKGYWYVIRDPEASVRAERGSPDIALYYTYAGSVQKVEMPLTAVI